MDRLLTIPPLIGVPLWLGLLVLPGIGIGEALNLWEDEPMLLRLGTAIGLGLSANVLIWLAGSMAGVIGYETYAASILSAVLLVGSIIRRRRFLFPVRPSIGRSKAVILLFAAMAAVIFAYFSSSPYFANVPSVDFDSHVRDINSLLSAYPPLPSMVLYYGAYFQLGPLSLLSGGAASTLYIARYGMAALVLLSFFIVSRVSWDLSHNSAASAITTAIYSLGAFVWFVDAFDVGLWANFYGILAALFLVSASLRYFEAKKVVGVPHVIFVAIALVNALFSHYSTLLVFPALAVFGLWKLPSRTRASAMYLAMLLVPIGAGIVLFGRSLIPALLSFGNAGGSNNPPAPTWLSSLIPMPSLGYTVALISNDIGSAALLLCIFPYVRLVLKSKDKAALLVPAVWFASCLAFAPFNAVAWRFAVVALVPLVFMDGIGLFSLIPFDYLLYKGERLYYLPKAGLGVLGCMMWLVLLPVPFVSLGSWGSIATATAASTPAAIPQDQAAIRTALEWMGHHADCTFFVSDNPQDLNPDLRGHLQPEACRYLSVAEWRFSLSELAGGPSTDYAPRQGVDWTLPEQSVFYAGTQHEQFLIVTKYISEPSVASVNLTLVKGQDLTAVEQNVTATIAKLNATNLVGSIGAFPIEQDSSGYSQQIARFLDPWDVYMPVAMPGYNIVYQDSFVRIWCISEAVCGGWSR